MNAPVNFVKVFSATMARDRATLGERVTAWLRANTGFHVIKAVVAQSSDAEFHCLSITLFGHAQSPAFWASP
jgi:hypothetical protein